ncbi:MAG: SNF2-related protein, partial [Planctomycetota bacterium]
MSLADHLRPLLPARVRGRSAIDGEVEFVVIEDDAPRAVRATVHGRESHGVTLRLGEGWTWSASCTCPLFQRTGACRHLWAVVSEADERGLELARTSPPEPNIEPTYTALDPRREVWQARMGAVAESLAESAPNPWEGLVPRVDAAGVEMLYLLDLDDSRSGQGLVLRPFFRSAGRAWNRRRPYDPDDSEAPSPENALDQRILRGLRSARRSTWTSTSALSSFGGRGGYWLDDEECELLLPILAETGRSFLHHHGDDETEPLIWDDGQPWALGASLERDERGRRARVVGFLARGGERLPLDAPHHILRSGFLFLDHRVARLDVRGAWALAEALREGPIEAPLDDADELAQGLIDLPGHPLLEGERLHLAATRPPRPHLRVELEEGVARHECHIRFDYGLVHVSPTDPRGALRSSDDGEVVRRDWEAERKALAEFMAAGGQRSRSENSTVDATVASERLDELILRLTEEGWTAEVGGRQVRPAGTPRLSVRSGIDWFDLEGGLTFGDQVAPLPDLLKALNEGRRTLQLADGTLGLLPDAVRREWALLAGVGVATGSALRFKNSQGWLLDRLLAQRPGVDVDASFAALRKELAGFEGLQEELEPDRFQGTLRPYQRVGLSWFRFLRAVNFGGCLADDMGLGKTVQVLAMLLGRAREQGRRRPNLGVVPRSLLFHWQDEAARFTPELRVADHTGPERAARREALSEYDIVLTTYGTLRRDALTLREVAFDYVILDEAQAIKNHRRLVDKAALLLEAHHRLSLSATPIENHLGELWSLFEFLNPGMLGRARGFRELVAARGERAVDPGGRSLLAAALRPFFLRRTKQQVLPDLPPKIEQIMWCELGEEQRSEYDALLEHYRASLVSDVGNTDRFRVLRALLRLRQAACHP